MRLLLLLIFIPTAILASNLNDEQKIEKLLTTVEQSGLTFVRNGKEYNSKKARSHMEYKYKYVKDGFFFWQKGQKVTVRDFIDKLASKSSTSGKPYFIKTKEGTLVPTRDWLNNKLKEIETNQ